MVGCIQLKHDQHFPQSHALSDSLGLPQLLAVGIVGQSTEHGQHDMVLGFLRGITTSDRGKDEITKTNKEHFEENEKDCGFLP